MQSKQAFPLFIALISLITLSDSASAQNDSTKSIPTASPDSLSALPPGNEVDTADSSATNISPDALKSKVTYQARDTVRYDFASERVFLYGDAKVLYEDIELRAEFIELKMDSDIVYATGVQDSTGKVIGSPVFIEGGQEFRSQKMTYNFVTKKGKIREVITQDGEGYVHGKDVKKSGDDVIYIQNGLYTTCEHEHPHFSIWAKQLKIIPNDKIIVKPANLIIEDVNTPVILPFGVFPNKKGGKSGILVPMPGESDQDGFYLFNAGYYFYISEKADFEVEADVYSKGSYAIRPSFNYKKRYSHSGWLKMRHKNSIRGVIPEDPDYAVIKDYWLDWNHRQEANARPNSNFSANVNLGTSTSYRNDLNTPDSDFLRGNFTSKISYTRYMLNRKVIFSLNGRQNQNNTNNVMNLTLPEANLSVTRFYPFKSATSASKRWYENIGVSYNGNFRNELNLNTKDVIVSTENMDTIASAFRNGIQHNIPLGTNIKMMKYFTLNPSVNYREVWYFESVEKSMDPLDTLHTINEVVKEGFIRGNSIDASMNLTTKVYGMMQFRKGYIRAFRHVMTPSAGISYNPENRQGLRTYTSYADSVPKEVEYSVFEKGIYGRPDSRESARITLGLLNSFEMKVKTKSDTGDGTKKVKLLENLRFGTSYDLLRDSMNWDNVSVSGNSSISRNVNVLLGSTLDLYALKDSAAASSERINRFEWEKNGRLARLVSGNAGLNFNLSGGSGKKRQERKEEGDNEQGDEENNEDTDRENSLRKEYISVDWEVPWTLNVQFNLQYRRLIENYKTVHDFTTNTQANGDLSLTKNWRITYNAMIDMEEIKINYATLGITRNLHCWQMTLSWVPIGVRKSYTFHIGVKANILQDLKMDKRSF